MGAFGVHLADERRDLLIGCLPGYAVIGVGAPASASAAAHGAVVLGGGRVCWRCHLYRGYAPHNHRGFYCSMVPASTATGLLVGSLLAFMFTVWGADSAFVVDWGWRIPFWLALPLGYITHYSRTHLEDSPVYAQMQERMKDGREGWASHSLFTKHLRVLLISFGACVLNAVSFYAVLVSSELLGDDVELPASDDVDDHHHRARLIAFIFLSGRISDKVGRKKMLIGACVGFIVFTVPAFMLLGTMNFWVILLVELLMCPLAHHQRRHSGQLPYRDVPRPMCATPASPSRSIWRTPSSAARPRSSRSG